MYTWCIVSVLLGSCANVFASAPLDCEGSGCSSNRTCEPLSSSSLAVNCVLKRRGVSCDKRISPGTKANLFCKEGFEQLDELDYSQITCGDDGVWDKCPFTCRRTCGYPNPKSDDSDIGRFPWHASVFRKISEDAELTAICGGTIIEDDMILTAAHCIFDETSDTKVNVHMIKIAVGTGFAVWNDEKAKFAQFYNVKQIIIHPQFEGLSQNYKDDIAIIIIVGKIEFNDYIAPACIDYEFNGGITETSRETKFAVTIRDLDSGYLENLNLTQLSLHECREKSSAFFLPFLSDKKLCARDPDSGRHVGLQNYGGSAAMLAQESSDGTVMYVRGIVSVDSIDQGIVTITDVLAYLDWIEDVKASAVVEEKPQNCTTIMETTSDFHVSRNESTKCVVPPLLENGKYALGGFAVTPPPGSTVPEFTYIKYSCNDGYALTENDAGVCANGHFTSPPTCFKKCKPLTSDTVELRCTYKGKQFPCDEPVKFGTVAQMRCRQGYKLPYPPDINSIICGIDGEWDSTPYKCNAECGLVRPKGISLIGNRHDADSQHFPWHVSIYRKSNANNYELICGGSIISNKLVVTAASCLYEPGKDSPVDKSEFAVAVGKVYVEWENPNDTYAQYSGLEDITAVWSYKNLREDYAHDIAILKLSETLQLSSTIRPICVDFESEDLETKIADGTEGIVSGWGAEETRPQLKFATLPVVSYEKCLRESPSDARPFITVDKFCAVNSNGTNFCQIGNGAGLAIPVNNGDNDIYYLRGVMSTGPRVGLSEACSPNNSRYIAFTSILPHTTWFRTYRRQFIPPSVLATLLG